MLGGGRRWPARGACGVSALLAALAPALFGCGRLGFESLSAGEDGAGGADGGFDAGVGSGADAMAACRFGPFSEPVQVFESDAPDYGPSLSSDGLTLFVSSVHTGGQGSTDLWTVTRPDLESSFSSLANLAELNTGSSDAEPALSSDDLTLYFESDRDGTTRLWSAARSDPGAAFGAPSPLAATDPGLIENALGPSVTADGLELYFASDEGPRRGIWRATRASASEPFAAPGEVVELRARDIWGYPSISPDGLELYYVLTGGDLDIVVARRPDRQSPFSAPELIAELDAASNSDPQLSGDGRTIFFTSDRDGDWDVWAATRDCLP